MAMVVAPGGGPPDFDAAAAWLLLNRCQNPPSLQPGEPGLRALWAVEHVHHFTTNKEAWEYYGAGKQSYFTWKRSLDGLVLDAALAVLARSS